MQSDQIKIIQISDVHLMHNSDGELLKVPTQKSFQAVIDFINQQEKNIHCIILTGDLAQDGSENAYQRVADMLDVFHVPVYCVPGNHDNLSAMQRVYPRGNIVCERQVILPHWQMILLDSHIEGAVPGKLDRTQLNFMENCLRDHPELNAMIMFHHPPFLVESTWLDNILLQNQDEFWQTILPYQLQIKAIVCGHVHQENAKQTFNIPCYSVPSTCIQFKRRHNEFALDDVPPGYRWIELAVDGQFKTGVRRVEKYVGEFDERAKGY